MRKYINIVEGAQGDLFKPAPVVDPNAPTVVTFKELSDHFKSKYKIDLTDVNSSEGHFNTWLRSTGQRKATRSPEDERQMAAYTKHPQGHRIEPEYFNFWHWLVEKSETVPWETTSGGRQKLFPLSLGLVTTPSEEDVEHRALMMQMQKDYGQGWYQKKSFGVVEADDILTKIFADYGPKVSVLMSVSG